MFGENVWWRCLVKMFGENVCHNKRKKVSDQKSKNKEVTVGILERDFQDFEENFRLVRLNLDNGVQVSTTWRRTDNAN